MYDIQLTFRYDYLGRRIEKQVSTWSGTAWTVTQARRYGWDGWRMLLEMDGSGTILKKYTWGLDLAGLNGQVNSLEGARTIGGLLAVQVVGGAVGGGDLDYAYLYDANGNVGQLVDWAHDPNDPNGVLVARYEYDPYGGVTAATGSYAADNAWRFSTKQFDAETGLGYWGHRYYSAALGRWISRDPIGERGGANLFAFTGNRPLNVIDPVGLDTFYELSIGQSRVRGAFWHYMFGHGEAWYRDDWAPDVQRNFGYQVLVDHLTRKIRAAACKNFRTLPCGQERTHRFSDNSDLLSAWNTPSIAPFGRFHIWATADCRFKRSCVDCRLKHTCNVKYEVRDPFSFDPGALDELGLMFMKSIMSGIAFDKMCDSGHAFTIYVRWRDGIRGDTCCDATSGSEWWHQIDLSSSPWRVAQ